MHDYIDYDDVNYQWLTEEAWRRREAGEDCGVEDLLAMNRHTDPFYRGQAADVAKAEWFRQVWDLLRLDRLTKAGNKVHLRRVHYLLVSRSEEMPPVPWCEQERYLNTLQNWKMLGITVSNARYLGIIPFNAIEDQRNPAPRRNTPWRARAEPEPTVSVKGDPHKDSSLLWLPRTVSYTLPEYEVEDYEADQRYHCEVWVEKSTVEDVLSTVCLVHRTNLMFAAGELSITQVYEAAARIAASKRPARIFYISDYDPKGTHMPVSAGRKLEWFIHGATSPLRRAFVEYELAGCNVTLTPLALTEAQIAMYKLPRQPLKDQKGKSEWELRHGEGGVEMDALEALYPGVLAHIVRQALAPYYDKNLDARVEEAKEEAAEDLGEVRREVVARHQADLAAIRERYDELLEEFGPRLEEVRSDLDDQLEEIKQEMEEEAAGRDIQEEYPVPEAEEADEDPNDALLWSERSYDEQLEEYHDFERRDRRNAA